MLVKIKGLLTVLVAAALVLSVGMTSTSLDAVETDPSDEVDTSWIPTQDNKPQQSQNSGGGSTSGSGSSTTSGGSGGETETEKPEPGDGDTESGLEQVTGSVEDTMDLSSGEKERQTKGGGGGGGGGKESTLPLWRRLLNLLMGYIWYIIAALAGIGALVGGYLYYKRRFGGMNTDNPVIVYDVDTSNDVYKSWWEMVEMVDAEEPSTKTPQEFAEMAVGEGLEQEAVSELTSLFEEALYGGKEVTKEQEKRAREAVERLKAKGRDRDREAV